MRPLDRGRLLERLALLVEAHADDLARLETLDNGKPLAIASNKASGIPSWRLGKAKRSADRSLDGIWS
jgi:acyl-CoA reductase-like NAD-dependent aldehyde dehydrogenase